MHPFYTRAATMIGEIAAAVSFISKFLRTKGLTSERQLQTFSQSLQELLAGEWAPEGGRGAPVVSGPVSADRAVGVAGFSAAPRAGRTLVPPRDPGWCAGRPLTAGPGKGLGARRRAPPSPHDWQTEGRRKQTHNKETKANRGGSCGPWTVRGSGDKGAAGLGWLVRCPLPLTPSSRCSTTRPGMGNRAAAREPAWDGRAVSVRLLPQPINHRICHRYKYSPVQSVV